MTGSTGFRGSALGLPLLLIWWWQLVGLWWALVFVFALCICLDFFIFFVIFRKLFRDICLKLCYFMQGDTNAAILVQGKTVHFCSVDRLLWVYTPWADHPLKQGVVVCTPLPFSPPRLTGYFPNDLGFPLLSPSLSLSPTC